MPTEQCGYKPAGLLVINIGGSSRVYLSLSMGGFRIRFARFFVLGPLGPGVCQSSRHPSNGPLRLTTVVLLLAKVMALNMPGRPHHRLLVGVRIDVAPDAGFYAQFLQLRP